MTDTRAIKPEDNVGGTFTQQLTIAEVTTAYVSPVPTVAPGVIVCEPGTVNEEAIHYKTKDAGAGTISGLTRDYTNLNSGTGIQHENGEDWEIYQNALYVANLVDILTEGYLREQQTVARTAATTFTVVGNVAALYTAGRVVRFNGDNTEVETIVSSSYSAGTGLTTVTVTGSIPDPLTYVEVGIQPKAAAFVQTIGDQTVAGVKTFSSSPVVPDPTTAQQAASKAYVDSGTVTMTNKTLTSPVIQGLVDGWTLATDTWVYASASTFTIAGVDRTAMFPKGTRLKFTQTTAKYAVVVSSSFSTNTTVTIAVNTDYTIANAAITAPYYSYQASPQGYPGWFAYTPTPNNLTVGSGTLTGRFSLTGTTASFYINFVFSSTGSAVGTAPTVTLPISALNVGVYYSSIEDYGTTRFGAYITRVDATTIQINCWSAAASHLTYALVASGVPMTWVNNDSFVISGQYEIA